MKVLFQTIVILCSLSMANCLRILFLHGSGGRGAHFQKSMQCLLDRITAAFVDVEFVFPDAIYEKEDGGYCWWTFPAEGLRSTDSPELIGREASVDFVLSHKPCDVIVGHSQAARPSYAKIADCQKIATPHLLPNTGVADRPGTGFAGQPGTTVAPKPRQIDLGGGWASSGRWRRGAGGQAGQHARAEGAD